MIRMRVHRKCGSFLINGLFVISLLIVVMWIADNLLTMYDPPLESPKPSKMRCFHSPSWEYEDEVDLRIIVMGMNRSKSLDLCLQRLHSLILDGDTAVVDIWLDRDKLNKTDLKTLQVAKSFKWKQGRVNVHVQDHHVGIYGQWIDTWRPKKNTKEIALFLEDDIDVSPYIYRWTKAAHQKYDSRTDVAGYSLSEIDIIKSRKYDDYFERPTNVTTFMFKRFGTFGFSPKPDVWMRFQDWFHYVCKYDPYLKPYVFEDYIFTRWYQIFEKRKTMDGMWSMWFEYFAYHHNLFTVFPNIGSYLNKTGSLRFTNTTFAFHRREVGMHFKSSQLRNDSKPYLLTHWDQSYVDFPHDIPKYDYSGRWVP